jgi:potassium-dependent mechanosensitive channel
VTFGALLLGYVAFSAFISNQFVWCLIIGGAAYLLAVVVDDLSRSLLGNTKAGQADGKEPAAQEEKTDYLARTRAQAAVLVSAIVRVGIYFLGLLLILAPYGEGPLELLNRAGRINEGLSIGEVSLKPGALLQAALLLVLGLAAVRLFKRWLTDRFMPTTQMDAGMRMSIITLSGYAGTVVIIALAISAVGMGLERVTWVASALSVGIGFGLQAIVQNFVSGLILLAERPVKVGDWVSVSGVEGDIRKINVRATEIQMGDRSTLIIPNSEFITKIVRNVTYSDNIGLVQVKLPMPLSTDTKAAREVLIEAFRNHRGVLSTPAPTVQLEGVTDGRLVFVATGFVNSPRAAGNVKSELLFDIFEKLRAAHITLEQPAAIVMKPSP